MTDEFQRMRQREYATRNRRKNREFGLPGARLIQVAYFEAVREAIAAAVRGKDAVACSRLLDIEDVAISKVMGLGFERDEVLERQRLMVDRVGTDNVAGVPSGDLRTSKVDDLMIGEFLDLSALKKAVDAERAERETMVALVMSPVWTEAASVLAFLSARTLGFPTTLRMGRFFGAEECILEHGPHGWAVRSLRGVSDPDRGKGWTDFDRERFLREVLLEIGMGDSEVAYRMFDSIVPESETGSNTESDATCGDVIASQVTPVAPIAADDGHGEGTDQLFAVYPDDVSPAYPSPSPSPSATSYPAVVLEEVIAAIGEIVGEGIVKDGRVYRTESGQRIKLSMAGRHRGGNGRNFKITPDHLEFDYFVVWKSEGGGGWMIPIHKLRDFLECCPSCVRTNGAVSWDPRIGADDGRDWLWTDAARYGRMDITHYAF